MNGFDKIVITEEMKDRGRVVQYEREVWSKINAGTWTGTLLGGVLALCGGMEQVQIAI